MTPAPEPFLPAVRRTVLLLALLGLPLTFIGVNRLWELHPVTAEGRLLPYGFAVMPDHFTPEQDFTYNMNFLREIWEHRVERPYRLADQEQMVRDWIPDPPYGLVHAYSPVALVLAAPFLYLPPRPAYLLYISLSYLGLLALLKWYLLPRCRNSLQVFCFIPCLLGYSLATSMAMGQTSLFTTGCLALLSVYGEKRVERPRWGFDLILAGLAWVICAKPSIGLLALALLTGLRLWRALFCCGGMLLLTWMLMAGHYGGWLTGLRDYVQLLGHYCHADMTPFFRDSFTILSNTSLPAFLIFFYPAGLESSWIFTLSQQLSLAGYALLILLAWRGWLTSENFLRALLWNFLLFTPYLLATEDWVLCLFIAGNAFFRPAHGMSLKLLLLAGIMNGRIGIVTFWPLFFPVKLALCGWWLVGLLRRKDLTPV